MSLISTRDATFSQDTTDTVRPIFGGTPGGVCGHGTITWNWTTALLYTTTKSFTNFTYAPMVANEKSETHNIIEVSATFTTATAIPEDGTLVLMLQSTWTMTTLTSCSCAKL